MCWLLFFPPTTDAPKEGSSFCPTCSSPAKGIILRLCSQRYFCRDVVSSFTTNFARRQQNDFELPFGILCLFFWFRHQLIVRVILTLICFSACVSVCNRQRSCPARVPANSQSNYSRFHNRHELATRGCGCRTPVRSNSWFFFTHFVRIIRLLDTSGLAPMVAKASGPSKTNSGTSICTGATSRLADQTGSGQWDWKGSWFFLVFFAKCNWRLVLAQSTGPWSWNLLFWFTLVPWFGVKTSKQFSALVVDRIPTSKDRCPLLSTIAKAEKH